MTPFAEWVSRQMASRGFGDNKSKLATYMGVAPASVSAWFNRGTIPNTATCAALARALHVPLEEVLRVAGHIPAGVEAVEEPELPSWLRATLAELTDPELRVVERTAQGLLALREDRSQLEPGAAEPAPPAPRPRAPGEPPPAARP